MQQPDLVGLDLGPYRLVSVLGSGGMGTVYLAEALRAMAELELAAGDRVAVKVVHPGLFDGEGFLARFLREGRIGRRIRHRNVVPTLNADASNVRDATFLYIVMEYVEGRTLRRLLDDLGTVPDALIREIGAQLAAGLAAIHREGIVHRDVKPDNALITDQHEVRIMDLGVARLVEASVALTQKGTFAGTLEYAAPELFRGEVATPSSDLYSLGVVLYELATGRNPFAKASTAETIGAHLHDDPPAPDACNADVSLFLSQTIVRLLAKRSQDRFADADELLRTLAQGEQSAWWAERESVLTREVLTPLVSVRRQVPLRGRDAELDVLRRAWTDALSGRGGTVFIEGEPGIGKTRLVDAFIRELEAGETHVLYGSYPPSGGMGGISEAVLAALGSASLESALHRYVGATPSLVPGFAALMRRENLSDGHARLHADSVHAVMCHLMRGLARERPLLWVVDDLHFAEPDSRQIVLSLSRAVESSRALLIVTARPGLPREEIAHFSRTQRCRLLTLRRLATKDVIDLVAEVLKSAELTRELGRTLADKSDGVPLFLLDLIEDLAESGVLTHRPDGTYERAGPIGEIRVPSAVRDLVRGRLEGLDDDERSILDVAAVHGFRFDPDLVARVRGMKRVVLLEKLALLDRRSGVVRGDGGRCRFDHHQVQEVLYGDLMPGLRAEYHSMLADAFADREGLVDANTGNVPGESAHFLASHHLLGTRPREGVRYLDRALDHLAAAHRRDAALALARRTLDQSDLLDAAEREALLLRTAGFLDLAARRDEQRAALEAARASADTSGDAGRMARARSGLGWHWLSVSRPARARPWLAEALDLARRAGDKSQEAIATGHLGTAHLDLSHFDDARSHFERQLSITRELGDRAGEATALGNLGIIAKLGGRYDDARDLYEADLAIARESGDRVAEGISTANLGILVAERGRYDEARELYGSALAAFQEMGYRRGDAATTGYLGAVAKALGRYGESRECHRSQITLAREIGNPAMEAIALVNSGEIERDLGAFEEATESLERALSIFRETGDRRSASYAVHGLGEVASWSGRATEAETLLEEALAVRREIAFPRGQMETLLALGRLHADLGRDEQAAQFLAEALVRAEELDAAEGIVLVVARLALLPGGDGERAVAAFSARESRLRHGARMEARFLLWRITDDVEQLRHAARLLDHLVEYAPEASRATMVDRVPLHRAVRAAASA